jgi:hypothetical protein
MAVAPYPEMILNPGIYTVVAEVDDTHQVVVVGFAHPRLGEGLQFSLSVSKVKALIESLQQGLLIVEHPPTPTVN